MPYRISLSLIVAALLAYSALTLWQAVAQGVAWYLVWTLPALVAAIGLVLRRAWSRFVLYFLNACLVAGWGVYAAFMWQHVGETGTLRLAALGAALFAFAAWSGWVVWSFFRERSHSQAMPVGRGSA